MFKIGDFSKLSRVSVRMLRYYDDIGLFKPAEVDDFTGYRYYAASQIKTINMIVSLRDMGFNVNDISAALNEPSKKQYRQLLLQKKAEITHNIIKQESMISRLDEAIRRLNEEDVMKDYQVKLISVPTYKVLSIRDIIPAYNKETILWDRMCDVINKQGIKVGDMHFSIYHDEGHKDKDVDVEVVMEAVEPFKSGDGYCYRVVESVDQMAAVQVTGDFSNIAPAFRFLGEWIEKNEYTICGASRQRTLKGPWNESNPEHYLAEIQIPVKK